MLACDTARRAAAARSRRGRRVRPFRRVLWGEERGTRRSATRRSMLLQVGIRIAVASVAIIGQQPGALGLAAGEVATHLSSARRVDVFLNCVQLINVD